MQKAGYNTVSYSLEAIYEKYKNLSMKFAAPLIIHLCQISFLSWVEKGRDRGATMQT